jgi:hypothetical protein
MAGMLQVALSENGRRHTGSESRVGQICIYTPIMTVCMVTSLPQNLYIHQTYMVLAKPK